MPQLPGGGGGRDDGSRPPSGAAPAAPDGGPGAEAYTAAEIGAFLLAGCRFAGPVTVARIVAEILDDRAE